MAATAICKAKLGKYPERSGHLLQLPASRLLLRLEVGDFMGLLRLVILVTCSAQGSLAGSSCDADGGRHYPCAIEI